MNLLPSTQATRGVLDMDMLAKCGAQVHYYSISKPFLICAFIKTVFINAGRGDITPSDDTWAEALSAGLLRVIVHNRHDRTRRTHTII